MDDLERRSVWCIRVLSGDRGQGISHHLLKGAVELARSYGGRLDRGTSAIEMEGWTVEFTSAFVGTRRLFEAKGFV